MATVIVKVRSVPAGTGSRFVVLVTTRCDAEFTVVVTVEELLPGVGSVVVLVTDALLMSRTPLGVPRVTPTTNVKTTVPEPAARVPLVQVIVLAVTTGADQPAGWLAEPAT